MRRWPLIDAGGPAARRLEAGLDASAFLFLPILVFVPHGIAPLASLAGALSVGLIAAHGIGPWRRFGVPAALLALLILWGAVSAGWSPDPLRSLGLAARLAGLFAAELALAGAAGVVARPDRLLSCFLAGLALGLLIAAVELATGGAPSRPFFLRPFRETGLNQATDALAILLLPTAAALICRRQRLLGLLVGAVMAAAVFLLVGTAAKAALAAGFAMAAVLYARPRKIARIAAVVAAVAVIAAPLTLPRLARVPALLERADAFKVSASHRLLIWSFVGDRIAERPLAGWGLDASRAIPGGKDEIRPGQSWLPLHPHDAALQVWLELGAPGAALFALLSAFFWLSLSGAAWPRLYAAAAGGSLVVAFIASFATYGVWQEWWLGTLGFALFLVLVMARPARGR